MSTTQYTIDEIKEGCAPLWNNVECMTCSRLLSYIDDLLSQLKDGGADAICGCAHLRSQHRTAHGTGCNELSLLCVHSRHRPRRDERAVRGVRS
jgi:hypothetical protein